jgi:hypothetical protein
MNRKFHVVISGLLLLMACTSNSTQSAHLLHSLDASSVSDLQVDEDIRPLFGQITIVMLENLDITKAERLPYFKELMNKYAYTRNYTAITHPSLPNHVGFISGDTYGLSSDCSPRPDCHVPETVNNLADELEAAGLSWKAYL